MSRVAEARHGEKATATGAPVQRDTGPRARTWGAPCCVEPGGASQRPWILCLEEFCFLGAETALGEPSWCLNEPPSPCGSLSVPFLVLGFPAHLLSDTDICGPLFEGNLTGGRGVDSFSRHNSAA